MAQGFRPKVDYSLRPSKTAERRMIAAALARLDLSEAIRDYRYVGMGSIFFRDFLLFHRMLGIEDMISIEGEGAAETRARFNLPLACIELMMGRTADALPRIGFGDKPHIVWLDYESRVDPGVLADIESVAVRAKPGSILIATVNADSVREAEEREEWLNDLGEDRPEPANPRGRKDFALLSYRVLSQCIDTALRDRNAGEPEERRVEFRQAFHFVYADGPQMLTVGGGLIGGDDREPWDSSRIEELDFVRTGEEQFPLKVPPLTRREALHLLRAAPAPPGDIEGAAKQAGIPLTDARRFATAYRYVPRFVEAEDW